MKVELRKLVSDRFRSSMSSLVMNQGLKASISWRLLGASKIIRQAYEDYDKIRLDLCVKYGQKKDDGTPVLLTLPDGGTQYSFSHEGGLCFNEEFQPFLNQTLDLPEPTVKASDLSEVNLTVEDLLNLVGVLIMDE